MQSRFNRRPVCIALVAVLSMLAFSLGACDSGGGADAPPVQADSGIDLTGRFVGAWGSEDDSELYELTVGLIVIDGDVVGTGNVLRRRAVGPILEETEFPVTGVSGALRADSSAVLQVRFATGQTAVLEGRYLEAIRFVTGTLRGASPFGLIEEEEFLLVRVTERPGGAMRLR